jgi:hypothetical protein
LTYRERQKSYGPEKLRWEEAEEAEEAEEKIRLKHYVCLRSKGRHNKIWIHNSLIQYILSALKWETLTFKR